MKIVYLAAGAANMYCGTCLHDNTLATALRAAGEDIFLEQLEEPFYSQAHELMRRYAADAHAYVAMNRYYADYMIGYMDLEPGRVHVIPPGLHLDGHGTRRRGAGQSSFTIGYF